MPPWRSSTPSHSLAGSEKEDPRRGPSRGVTVGGVTLLQGDHLYTSGFCSRVCHDNVLIVGGIMSQIGGTRNGRRWRWLALPLVVSVAAAACGDAKEGNPTSTVAGATTAGGPTTTAVEVPVAGGSALVLLFSESATLDPVKSTGSGGADGQRLHALYGGLVAYDSVKNVVNPLQAESLAAKGTDFASW